MIRLSIDISQKSKEDPVKLVWWAMVDGGARGDQGEKAEEEDNNDNEVGIKRRVGDVGKLD